MIHPRSNLGTEAVPLYSAIEPRPPAGSPDDIEEMTARILSTAAPELLRNIGDASPRCIYDGAIAGELRALLASGIGVTVVLSVNFEHTFRPFSDRAQLNFLARGDLDTANGCDLLWVAAPNRGETLRAKAASSLTSGHMPARGIFSDATHDLLDRLKDEGAVITYGRAALEVDAVPQFKLQLAGEFAEHGIILESLHALRIATGIFIAVGWRSATARARWHYRQLLSVDDGAQCYPRRTARAKLVCRCSIPCRFCNPAIA